MLTSPHSRIPLIAMSLLLLGHGAGFAQSGTPDARFNGRDASFELSAGSTLRRGDKLTDMLLATVWQRTVVKGAGSCSQGACPVMFNGEEMYARRSRLRIVSGGDSGNRGSTGSSSGSASRFPDSSSGASPGGTGASGSAGSSGYPDGLRRLQRGDKGEDVRRLQDALVKDGARLTPDGSYGRSTEAAIQAYQRRRNLKVDGVAGRETLRALGVMS